MIQHRKSIELHRRYMRKQHRVRRIQKTNGQMRESLYAKMDRAYNLMRVGLKEIVRDTMRLRRPLSQTAPDCPKQRWV